MKTVMIEIRDSATAIMAMVTVIGNGKELTLFEASSLLREGFGRGDYVLLTRFHPTATTYSPFDWDGRTMREAHKWLCDNPDQIEDGLLVDVEYILGETEFEANSEIDETGLNL